MFELHITPNKDFVEDFIDIATRYKLKLISHDNLDINGNFLYSETMIAEKCKDISELNRKIELLMSVAKQHNLLRVKIESEITDDFKCKVPYRMGAQYFEFHIDILVDRISPTVSQICERFNLAISTNPNKDTFMLTYRTTSMMDYKNKYYEVLCELSEQFIDVQRAIKEYCFCDDNLEVDTPWLSTYIKENNEIN